MPLISLSPDEIQTLLEPLQLWERRINQTVYGQPLAIRKIITAYLSGGHVLLDDFPGTGKTTLAKELASSLGMHFKRVQFTPDLMPSDITGVSIFNPQNQDFIFHPGPVFSDIFLADEINRASPRVQSALLEAMAERQVTTEGTTRTLSDHFFVIATENPQESAGAYPLPEAQLDRFAIRLSLGYLSFYTEMSMVLNKSEGGSKALDEYRKGLENNPLPKNIFQHSYDSLKKIFDKSQLAESSSPTDINDSIIAQMSVAISMIKNHAKLPVDFHRPSENISVIDAYFMILRNCIDHIFIDPRVAVYLTALVRLTRQHDKINLGASSRALIHLMRLAQTHAFIEGRMFVEPQDFMPFILNVLSHRVNVKQTQNRILLAETLTYQALLDFSSNPSALKPIIEQSSGADLVILSILEQLGPIEQFDLHTVANYL